MGQNQRRQSRRLDLQPYSTLGSTLFSPWLMGIQEFHQFPAVIRFLIISRARKTSIWMRKNNQQMPTQMTKMLELSGEDFKMVFKITMLQGAIISRAWPKWKNRKPQQRKKRYRDKLKFENWKIKYPRNKTKQKKRPCKNFTEGAQRDNEEYRRNQWTLRLKTIEVTQPAHERQPFALNEVDPSVGWM